jgi:hypothetical protein
MSFDAGTILGHMQLDRSGFTTSILEAQGLTHMLGESISTFLANPMLGVANLAMEAASALKNLVMGTVNAGVEFKRLSETTGASVHFLSGVAYACKEVDLPAEQVAESMNQLTRGIREAALGTGPAAQAFAQLGINVKDSNGQLRPMQEIFMQTADALSHVDNATQRAAMAQEIFGRAGMKLLPILNQGRAGINGMIAEADRLGVTMDDKAAQGAENFHKSLLKMEATFQGLAQKTVVPIFEALAPVLEEVAQSLGSVLAPIMARVGELMKTLAPVIGELVQSLGEALMPVIQAVFDIFEALAPLLTPLLALVGQLAGLFANILAPALQIIGAILRPIAELVGAIARGIGAFVGDISGVFGGVASSAGLAHTQPGGGVAVNVQVDPEASARHVSNQVAPAISHAVHGVQKGVESSTRRRMEMNAFQQTLAVR